MTVPVRAPLDSLEVDGLIKAVNSTQSALFVSALGAIPDATPANSAMVLQSTASAAVNVGPALAFVGKSGNGVVDYIFAAVQAYKASSAAGDYSGGVAISATNSAGGLARQAFFDAVLGTILIAPVSSAPGLRLRGAPSQSVDLQRWEDSTPTTLAAVHSDGSATFPALTVNSNSVDGSVARSYALMGA